MSYFFHQEAWACDQLLYCIFSWRKKKLRKTVCSLPDSSPSFRSELSSWLFLDVWSRDRAGLGSQHVPGDTASSEAGQRCGSFLLHSADLLLGSSDNLTIRLKATTCKCKRKSIWVPPFHSCLSHHWTALTTLAYQAAHKSYNLLSQCKYKVPPLH